MSESNLRPVLVNSSAPGTRAGRWRGAACALALAAACLSACQPRPPLDTPPPGIAEIKPLPPDSEAADRWYREWADQPDRLDASPVREGLLNLFVPSVRARRTPETPPGYIVQLVLVDASSNPLYAEGRIQAVLVARPQEPTAEAVAAWDVGVAESRMRYRRMLVPGYLLPLTWHAPPPRGDYMLVVRWTSADGQSRLTRNLLFQDGPPHAPMAPR